MTAVWTSYVGTPLVPLNVGSEYFVW